MIMKKIVPLLLASLFLAGCFQVDQVVTVGPDGSGTVEESFLISRQISESMAGFGEALAESVAESTEGKQPAPAPKPKPKSFFSDEEIRKRATALGEGVTFVSMKRIEDEKFEGYRAVFAFRDINRLRLDQKNDKNAAAAAEGADEGKGVRFHFKPGKPARLTIQQPKQAAREEKQESQAGTTVNVADAGPEQLDMLRGMFAGLRFRTALIIKGNIVETNATHRSGSQITLTDIDFGRLLDKPEQLAVMAKVPQGDMEAALEAMKKLPGMKVDLNDEVRVAFQ